MRTNKKSFRSNLRPFIITEVALLSLYLIFWILVIVKSPDWEWMRGDKEALIIYTIWGLIILGFCIFRLKKWMRFIRFENGSMTFRSFFSLRDKQSLFTDLIVVHKTKKDKTLVKLYSKYCDFYGQLYLDEEDKIHFLANLPAGEIEVVEDVG